MNPIGNTNTAIRIHPPMFEGQNEMEEQEPQQMREDTRPVTPENKSVDDLEQERNEHIGKAVGNLAEGAPLSALEEAREYVQTNRQKQQKESGQ